MGYIISFVIGLIIGIFWVGLSLKEYVEEGRAFLKDKNGVWYPSDPFNKI